MQEVTQVEVGPGWEVTQGIKPLKTRMPSALHVLKHGLDLWAATANNKTYVIP